MTADTAPRPGLTDYRTRELPDGSLLEFEYSPAGTPKADGELRQVDWRAYWLTEAWVDTPASERGATRRRRLVSVSTLLDTILPKPGLPPWSEARGIEGAIELFRRGQDDPWQSAEHVSARVRELGLGADGAAHKAASRGLNVHALLETYLQTGEPPSISEHPPEHHGYVRALSSWLLDRDPEPVRVEELVCDPAAGYAGRSDLVARCGRGDGILIRYDAKTQERCAIYPGAHLQVALYEQAAEACGDDPVDELRVVVFAADGEWREMPCEATPATVAAALLFAAAIKPINSLCESNNRHERNARQ